MIKNSSKNFKTGFWEFRTKFDRTYCRFFAFWGKTDNQYSIVISTHGIIKKANKTPKREIEKAERIRKQYFKDKVQDNENISIRSID